MALTQISTDGIKNGTITGSDLATNVDLVDNQKIRFGAGNDLEIFHSGTNSFIRDTGTGGLYVRASQFNVQNPGGTENMCRFVADGTTELYFNGSKKLGTDSAGTVFLDDTFLGDNLKANFGASADLQIYHDGSNSRIIDSGTGDLILSSSQLKINNAENTQVQARFIGGGPVEIYHNGTKKFETTAGGATVSGVLNVTSHLDMNDDDHIKLGDSDDFEIFHQSSNNNSIIRETGGGNLSIQTNGSYVNLYDSANGRAMATFTTGGSCEFKHGSTTRLETGQYGAIVTGTLAADNLDMGDNDKILLGDSDDLQIYHDGSHSRIVDSGTGNLAIQTNAININNADGTEPIIHGTAGGSVDLYHNDSKKLETTSTGVTVTGTVTATSFSGAFPADLRQSTDIDVRIGNSSDEIQFDASHGIRFFCDGTEEARLENDGDLHVDANVVAYSTTIASDERLKENIEIISNPLEKLEQIKGVSFDWKRDGKKSAGVIAQDVLKVLPEAVKEVKGLKDDSTHLSVNYQALTSILIEAVKELSDKVKKLEEK